MKGISREGDGARTDVLVAGFGFGLLIGGMFERVSYLADVMSWPSGIGISGGFRTREEVVVGTRDWVYKVRPKTNDGFTRKFAISNFFSFTS